MEQIARNLTDCEDGFLNGQTHLLHDRDGKFTDGFIKRLEDSGVKCEKLPPRSPNCNAYIERFMLSINDARDWYSLQCTGWADSGRSRGYRSFASALWQAV
jgi:hypothetical protein